MMKSVLLVGEWFSNNLGDGLIGEVVKRLFDENNILYYYFDIGLRNCYSKENDTTTPFSIKKERKLRVKRLVKKCLPGFVLNAIEKRRIVSFQETIDSLIDEKNINCIVFGGGQMFMDFFCLRLEALCLCAKKKNIPIFFNACGIDDKASAWSRKKFKRIVNDSITKYVSLRDGEFGFLGKKAIKTFDTAIFTSDYFSCASKNGKLGIGIMLSRKQGLNKQIRFWKNTLNALHNKNIDFELFCNGSPTDYSFIMYLKEIIGLDESFVCHRPKTPEDLISVVSKYKAIVSMRLHSLLLSYSYGIPCIGISWDSKVSDFFKKIKNVGFCIDFQIRQNELERLITKVLESNNFFGERDYLKRMAHANLVNMFSLLKETIDEQ